MDSRALIGKLSLWEERDKAITAGYEKLNNVVLPKVSSAPEAGVGAKSDKKFQRGFKKHIAVDMQSDMITKVAVISVSVTDSDGIKHIFPKNGIAAGDKGYVGVIHEIPHQGLHPMVIKRKNTKEKNADLDRWITKLRLPYERTYSNQ